MDFSIGVFPLMNLSFSKSSGPCSGLPDFALCNLPREKKEPARSTIKGRLEELPYYYHHVTVAEAGRNFCERGLAAGTGLGFTLGGTS